MVSPHRYEYLMRWKWHAVWSKKGRCFYAIRCGLKSDDRLQPISMHRAILGLMAGEELTGDHGEAGETLNNTDENLRRATRSQQVINRRRGRNNTSGYKGVSWHKASGKWRASIRVDGRQIHLGLFDTPELAYAAYCAAAIKYHGEFARVA
jgi:hypothetical protein